MDVLASASRVMGMVTSRDHGDAALRVKELLAKFKEVELLVKVGEYQKGVDPVADLAIERNDAINAFLKQRTEDLTPFDETVASLMELAQ